MVMLRKNYSLYFLIIGRLYPTVKVLAVTFPLDKMWYNTVFITFAHYFIYLKRSFTWYSDFNKFVVVELPFDTTILQVWQFINRLWHACNNVYNFKYFCWKCLLLTFSKSYLPHRYSCKIAHFKLDTSAKNFGPQAIYLLPYRINIRGRHFARRHGYCGMDSVVVTC